MFTTSLATDQDALERVGGKGRSLSKMAREGFNVPTGFIVTADAYRSFIADNGLQNQIVSEARPQLKEGYPAFDHCSTVIGVKIQKATIDATIVTAIKTAYRVPETEHKQDRDRVPFTSGLIQPKSLTSAVSTIQ